MKMIKLDPELHIEEALARELAAIKKSGRMLPKEVSISVDDFASMVKRLSAKVERQRSPNERGDDVYVDLFAPTGVVRVWSSLVTPGHYEPCHVRDFAIGDVVRLKTGGPMMTVEQSGVVTTTKLDEPLPRSGEPAHVHREIDQSQVLCVWFAASGTPIREYSKDAIVGQWTGPHRSRFDVDTLELVSKADATPQG